MNEGIWVHLLVTAPFLSALLRNQKINLNTLLWSCPHLTIFVNNSPESTPAELLKGCMLFPRSRKCMPTASYDFPPGTLYSVRGAHCGQCQGVQSSCTMLEVANGINPGMNMAPISKHRNLHNYIPSEFKVWAAVSTLYGGNSLHWTPYSKHLSSPLTGRRSKERRGEMPRK